MTDPTNRARSPVIRAEIDIAAGHAVLEPDPDRPSAATLWIDDVPQSYVDLADPSYLSFEYVRQIGDVIDIGLPSRAGDRRAAPRRRRADAPPVRRGDPARLDANASPSSTSELVDLVRPRAADRPDATGSRSAPATRGRCSSGSARSASTSSSSTSSPSGQVPSSLVSAECFAPARARAPADRRRRDQPGRRQAADVRPQRRRDRPDGVRARSRCSPSRRSGAADGSATSSWSPAPTALPIDALRRRLAGGVWPARLVDGADLLAFQGLAAIRTDAEPIADAASAGQRVRRAPTADPPGDR